MHEVDVHLLYIGCNSLKEGRAEVGMKIMKLKKARSEEYQSAYEHIVLRRVIDIAKQRG
jgi:hypothetical protein